MTTNADTKRHPRWPLLLISVSAGIATWSGWVGLGEATGFGIVHPLPGIADGVTLNSAITLPIGVEAYAAYAMTAWLTHRPLSSGTRRFAALSASGSLLLGMLGQVAYHLLTAAGVTRAPWYITTAVACIPVLVLGMAAALTHMVGRDGEAARTAEPVRTEEPRTEAPVQPVQPVQPVRTAETRTETPVRTEAPVRPVQPRMEAPRTVEPVRTTRTDVIAGLVAEIRTAGTGEWRPDYAAMMARTGYGRSWCEKAVRESRSLV